MSTRANIILTDAFGRELIFYKHCDGYPEGTLPILERFLNKVKMGQIRKNVGQAGGWLIVLGREARAVDGLSYPSGFNAWKVGEIEPTTQIHGDIEWLYVVDLDKEELRYSKISFDSNYKSHLPVGFYDGIFKLDN